MKLLLDTHALLWFLGDDPKLPEGLTLVTADENIPRYAVNTLWA